MTYAPVNYYGYFAGHSERPGLHKNNMTGVPGGTGDVDKVIQWSIDAANYMRGKGHPMMIMGHYADVGAAPDVVAKIQKYNAAVKLRSAGGTSISMKCSRRTGRSSRSTPLVMASTSTPPETTC